MQGTKNTPASTLSLPSPSLLTLSFSLGALKAKSTSKGSEATAAVRTGGRVFTYTFARNMCLTREGESEENDHAPRSSVGFDFSDRSYVPLFERSCKCSESGVAHLQCTKQIYLPPGISRSAQTADQISGKP